MNNNVGKNWRKISSILFLLSVLVFPNAILADRIRLKNGSVIEAEEVWEDGQAVWYKSGGMIQSIEKSKIKALERTKQVQPLLVEKETNQAPQVVIEAEQASTEPSSISDQRIWLHLRSGARVEVDEVSESVEGVWYKRGGLSILVDKAGIVKIEREQVARENRGRWTERGWTTGNLYIDNVIRENGKRFGIDPYLVFLVIEQESQFKVRAVSPKGARGLMQLMPATARRLGVRHAFDPAENVRGGTKYLKELMQRFNGRVDLVLAGYNAGEGAVMKYGHKVPPYRETRNYVKKISARYEKGRKESGAQ
jgi:hypothetical protein